ncbi:vitamin K epoxide reductase family protein [Acrocarpospora catenulata]|uniref:vitamin K epoxide reductase family protein n=1 Tax=Acrocarpospora catenulata TaxID=2836182 RepID=UPI001BDA7A8D|nr:vitamin K epoxide reductase family protein [Acrocarpospora catenulata]
MQRSPDDLTLSGDEQIAGEADRPFARSLPWLLLVGGLVGFAAAFTLTVEKIALLRDPDYVPTCSINPILSCGSVMRTPQAEVFGFPNPLIGVAAFAALAAIGAAMLAGARPRPWFWAGLQAGVTFGVVFVHWLIWQSLYVIGALCPYCMVVWVVTILLFWYVTLVNLGRTRAGRLLAEYHAVALTAWFLLIIGLITVRFWDYWSSLI